MRCIGTALLFIISSYVSADSWLPPSERGFVSTRGSVVVRASPRQRDENDGYATAKYFRWSPPDSYELYLEISLLNPVAPVVSLVHENGTLFTLDNWYSNGHGEVVVIYKPNGEILRSYVLSDLYPDKKKREKIRRSISSIWWRCETVYPYIYNDTVEVYDTLGSFFAFNLKTGSYTYESSGIHCIGRI